MNPKPEITAADFPALHTFLRGYFHEDVADEYGTAPEAADQFCEDAETDERIPVAREWQQLIELTGAQPAALNPGIEETRKCDWIDRRGDSAGFGDLRAVPGGETASAGGERVRKHCALAIPSP